MSRQKCELGIALQPFSLPPESPIYPLRLSLPRLTWPWARDLTSASSTRRSFPWQLWWPLVRLRQSCTSFWPQHRTCKSSFSSQGWYHWSAPCSSRRSNSCSIGTSERSVVSCQAKIELDHRLLVAHWSFWRNPGQVVDLSRSSLKAFCHSNLEWKEQHQRWRSSRLHLWPNLKRAHSSNIWGLRRQLRHQTES